MRFAGCPEPSEGQNGHHGSAGRLEGQGLAGIWLAPAELLRHSATYYKQLQKRLEHMSVRKRKWTTRSGEAKEAWVVDYNDQEGGRHIHTFARKKDADEYHATVKVDVRQGVHTAPSKT